MKGYKLSLTNTWVVKVYATVYGWVYLQINILLKSSSTRMALCFFCLGFKFLTTVLLFRPLFTRFCMQSVVSYRSRSVSKSSNKLRSLVVCYNKARPPHPRHSILPAARSILFSTRSHAINFDVGIKMQQLDTIEYGTNNDTRLRALNIVLQNFLSHLHNKENSVITWIFSKSYSYITQLGTICIIIIA